MKSTLLSLLFLLCLPLFGQQKEVLFDDFTKNKNNWEESNNPVNQKYVKNGFYHMVNPDEGSVTWNSIPVKIDPTQNFAIETFVSIDNKKDGEALLIFGENNKTNEFYFIQIRDVDKKYPIHIGKLVKGEWKGIWKNAKINTNKEYNRLTIKKVKDELIYLVNGIIVHTQKFEPFFGNGIGLGCGGPQHAIFDYVLVLENQAN